MAEQLAFPRTFTGLAPQQVNIALEENFRYLRAWTNSFIVTGAAIPHGGLLGLGDDDHLQYSLTTGARPFTGTVGGIDPIAASDLTTKNYVDGLIGGVDLQGAYDADTSVPQIVAAAGFPLTVDLGSGIGDVFAVRTSSAIDTFRVVGDGSISFGRNGRRFMELQQPDGTGRMGIELWPDDFTITSATGSGAAFYSAPGRLITTNIPGGGGLGNDTAVAGMNFGHTMRFEDTGFLFAAQLLINAAVRVEVATNTVGPLYLFLDQYKTVADGGARTVTQHNAIRAQPSWGPNVNGGSIVQTSAELFYAATTVDATVGNASILTLNYFAAKAPTLTAGGTIGTFHVLDIPNISAAGITTLHGISSAMNSGNFINHSGTASSFFGGTLIMGNSVELWLGLGAQVVLSRSANNTMRWAASAENLDWDFSSIDLVVCNTTTNTHLMFNLPKIALGTTAPIGSNWFFGVLPGAQATSLAGDWAHRLFSAGGILTLNHAMVNVFTDIVNEPNVAIGGGGSVVNAGVMLVQTNPNVGTNRYGVLITSNPSGGTINAALRVTAGLSRFDGRVDINNGIALGGGAAPTLGTIGGAGPTTAAQAQWVEIDIGGTAHWIPVWT